MTSLATDKSALHPSFIVADSTRDMLVQVVDLIHILAQKQYELEKKLNEVSK